MSGGPSTTGRPSSRSTSRSVVSRPETRSLTRFWGLLADADIPVVIHAGHAPVAAAYTGPDSFAPLLARHPRLTAIIAHMGAPDYADFVRLASQRPHHEGLPSYCWMAGSGWWRCPVIRRRLRRFSLASKRDATG